MFVAHLGELALFGASMATSFAGVTSFSFLHWILCVGKLLEQSSTICWAYTCRDTGSILSLFGQDPEIAAEVGAYSRWMIPTLFAYGLIQCHNRFLQTQNIVFPMMLITSVTALLDLTFVDVSPEELFHNERSFMNEVSKASPMETQSAKEIQTNGTVKQNASSSTEQPYYRQLFNLFKAHKDPKQNPIAYSCNRLRKTSYFFCIVVVITVLFCPVLKPIIIF
ncbi:protein DETOXIFICATION 17-like isoform X2 [Zingiber officinale]|uniref:protein DETOXIFICATION 17-like isoform X2 n=1 Tax=Zingiber officinale TaxID=94328 RepID=UPI001C4CE84C|nr:protein DETOXIFICATION 17-like isoform X2 [Zingiber officinale]